MKKTNTNITMEDLMKAINNINSKLDAMEDRISSLEGKKPVSKKADKKPAKQSKKSEPVSVAKPATRAEAIEAWCQKKGYSEADRKAYGEAKRAERDLQKKAYEMTNAQFTQKVDYKVWRAAYEANLKKLSK